MPFMGKVYPFVTTTLQPVLTKKKKKLDTKYTVVCWLEHKQWIRWGCSCNVISNLYDILCNSIWDHGKWSFLSDHLLHKLWTIPHDYGDHWKASCFYSTISWEWVSQLKKLFCDAICVRCRNYHTLTNFRGMHVNFVLSSYKLLGI